MICDYLKSSQTFSTSSLLLLYRQVTHDSSFFTRRLHIASSRLYRLSAPQCHLRSHFRHAKEAAKNTELSVKLISASQAAFAFASHRRQYLALIYFYLSALIISTSYTSPHHHYHHHHYHLDTYPVHSQVASNPPCLQHKASPPTPIQSTFLSS